jgi:hypothetical protein
VERSLVFELAEVALPPDFLRGDPAGDKGVTSRSAISCRPSPLVAGHDLNSCVRGPAPARCIAPRPLNRANSGRGAGLLKIRAVRPSVLDRDDRKDHNDHMVRGILSSSL